MLCFGQDMYSVFSLNRVNFTKKKPIFNTVSKLSFAPLPIQLDLSQSMKIVEKKHAYTIECKITVGTNLTKR